MSVVVSVMLFVVCWLLFVVCCLSFVVAMFFVVRCCASLFVLVRCVLSVVAFCNGSLLFVVVWFDVS